MTTGTHHDTADRAREHFVAWVDGRPGALDDLVRLLTPMLWHLARSYRLDQAEAEDAVQNAWLQLVRKRDTVQDPQAVLRWLSVTVRREAARMSYRRAKVDLVEDAEVDVRLPSVDSAEHAVVEDAGNRVLWRHAAELSERCRHLLRVLAFSDRPDYKNISDELGIPVGSIGPTRGRCLDKLRRACVADPEWSLT
jgi:RNA polymerase sigma factor (sigma-70 family)